MFCADKTAPLRFNKSTCNAIAEATPECERLITACNQSYNEKTCKSAEDYCETAIGRFFQQEVDEGRRSPYDLRQDCKKPPLCNTGGNVNTSIYLNDPKIQIMLGFTPPIKYTPINFALNTEWGNHQEISIPSTRELSHLLNNTSVDILVLNGNYDVTINTPSVIRQYDNLSWHSQANYQFQSLNGWFWTDEHGIKRKGGATKGIDRLRVVTVDDAGHIAPGDQREAVMELVGRWLISRGKTFGSVSLSDRP